MQNNRYSDLARLDFPLIRFPFYYMTLECGRKIVGVLASMWLYFQHKAKTRMEF